MDIACPLCIDKRFSNMVYTAWGPHMVRLHSIYMYFFRYIFKVSKFLDSIKYHQVTNSGLRTDSRTTVWHHLHTLLYKIYILTYSITTILLRVASLLVDSTITVIYRIKYLKNGLTMQTTWYIRFFLLHRTVMNYRFSGDFV